MAEIDLSKLGDALDTFLGPGGNDDLLNQIIENWWNQLIIFTDSRTILEIVLFWLNANRVSLFFSDSVTLRTILSVLV